MKLTDVAVRNAKPDKDNNKIKKLRDGKGLYLYVHPNGSKYWRFRKVINGTHTGKERHRLEFKTFSPNDSSTTSKYKIHPYRT